MSSSAAARFPLPTRFGLWRRALVVRRRLEAAVRAWGPLAILPLDDVAARLLRGLALDPRVDAQLRDLLIDSLGDPAGYQASVSRRKLMDLADRLALRKPHHGVLAQPSAILDAWASWGLPLVVKQENTCGGCGVSILHSPASVVRASRPSISRSAAATHAVKHHLRGKLARWAGFDLTDGGADLVQSFVPGKPAMCAVAAWRGEVLGTACFVAEETHPAPTGSSTVVTPLVNAEMVAASKQLVEALGCHGFVSFDFIVDEAGRACLIEMNARAIGVAALSGLFGPDICGLIAAKFGAQVPPRDVRIDVPRAVAQFPKELLRDPDSQHLRCPTVFHDVPWQDEQLMRIYLAKVRDAHPDRIAAINRVLMRAGDGKTLLVPDDALVTATRPAPHGHSDPRTLPSAVQAVLPNPSVRTT